MFYFTKTLGVEMTTVNEHVIGPVVLGSLVTASCVQKNSLIFTFSSVSNNPLLRFVFFD